MLLKQIKQSCVLSTIQCSSDSSKWQLWCRSTYIITYKPCLEQRPGL